MKKNLSVLTAMFEKKSKGGNPLHLSLLMTVLPLPHSRHNHAFGLLHRKCGKMVELENLYCAPQGEIRSGNGSFRPLKVRIRKSLGVGFCAVTNDDPACNSSARCKVTMTCYDGAMRVTTLALGPASIRHFPWRRGSQMPVQSV